MVSNWLCSMSRIRCGNSIVTTPSGASSSVDPADEVVHVRHLRQDVGAEKEIGTLPLGHELSRGLAAEHLDLGRHALGDRGGGDVASRLDAEHRDPSLHEVLQKVSVVAAELDHAGWRT